MRSGEAPRGSGMTGHPAERQSMDDDQRKFSREDASRYPLQPCPACGQRTMRYSFVDASRRTESYWIRGNGGCVNDRCVLNGGREGTMPE